MAYYYRVHDFYIKIINKKGKVEYLKTKDHQPLGLKFEKIIDFCNGARKGKYGSQIIWFWFRYGWFGQSISIIRTCYKNEEYNKQHGNYAIRLNVGCRFYDTQVPIDTPIEDVLELAMMINQIFEYYFYETVCGEDVV